MDNAAEKSEKDLKKAKVLRTVRIVWMILIPLFALIILWRLYNYANDKDNLSGILSPLGMIFIGLSTVIDERNAMLKKMLLGAAIISLVTSIILMFIY